MFPAPFADVDEVVTAFDAHDYLCDVGLATAVFLAARLERPLLLEGEAGVGKTEVAKVLAAATGGPLIRLQCWEGIDVSQALYEWDHSRQLLHLRTAEVTGDVTREQLEDELFTDRFLVRRPVLQALSATEPPAPVLLVDEIDRADDEFEAFLLEVLAEYTVTVPELGTVRAAIVPRVVLTSNRTRDVHDALKRRCLYHWVEHPDRAREIEIVRRRAPGVASDLVDRVTELVAAFRAAGLYKPPGVAETIDWADSLAALGVVALDDAAVSATLGTVLKYREDQDKVRRLGLVGAGER